ncbi:MAG: glycosyltransferase, partial [Alphaproteobacteria bacterium]
PSMRDTRAFTPPANQATRYSQKKGKYLVYVPKHGAAMFKGLDTVIMELEAARQAGLPIDIVTSETADQYFPEISVFKAAENMPSSYPIPQRMLPTVFRQVDFVVDQIIMGCYGNTGIEAMLCGAVTLGQKRYTEVADAPIVEVEAGTVAAALERLIADPTLCHQISADSIAYANRVHSPQAVGAVAKSVYEMVLN